MEISLKQPICLNLLTKEQIRDYYTHCNLYIRDGMKHRILKIQLFDKTWKYFYNIKTEYQLRIILVRYHPINAYCSITQWLNPKKVEHPNYLADRIPIETDLWIEVDQQEGVNPINEINNIYKYLIGRYKFNRCVSSGRGAYLYYKMPYCKIDNPKDRLKYWNKIRKEVITELYQNGFKVDVWVNHKNQLQSPCIDNFRVTRLEGSIRQNNGLKCNLIDINDIMDIDYTLLSYKNEENHTHALNTLKTPRSYYFITNKANDKNYILHLVFNKRYFDKDIIKTIINQYNLSDIYIFHNENYIHLISLKLISKERLLKIMNYCKSSNKSVFEKYNHSWIRLDLNYLGKINGKITNHISKPHNWYLNWLGIKTDYKRLVGWERPKLYEASHGNG